jgi:hypothetical protein
VSAKAQRRVLFHPLIQPKNTLSGAQKYFLRVLNGSAGKTVVYRGGLVEIAETHESLRQLVPLMESDLSESDLKPFWVPRRESDRSRFNRERRDRSRRHQTIGVVMGELRPKHARGQHPHSKFPGFGFLHRLITEMGYPRDAALAAFARPRAAQARPDRRRKSAIPGADVQDERQRQREPIRDYQRLDYGYNVYAPGAPRRRTLTGGGFTQQQASQGLSKMRTDSLIKAALMDIVYRRRSPLEVSKKTGIPVEKLYVYAIRLRRHIHERAQAMAA